MTVCAACAWVGGTVGGWNSGGLEPAEKMAVFLAFFLYIK